MGLFKFNLSLKDYEIVVKACPSDADARTKFSECEKIVKRIRFEKAIAGDEKPSVSLFSTIKELVESIGIHLLSALI